ncbi:MAG: hypothetical protein Q8Q09_18060 [Deltaproteobacteria bacterium]|nr:hypothetical protein [Deltaproteobacteria bacterium]
MPLMRRMFSLVLATMMFALPAKLLAQSHTPESVVVAYLRAGAAQDRAGIARWTESRCSEGPVSRVDAVRVLGIPVQIRSLNVHVERASATETVVRYGLQGAVRARDANVSILGARVRMRSVRMSSVSLSGRITLVRIASAWRVACVQNR